MEKRFVVFIVSSMLVLIAYQAISLKLNPPPVEEEVEVPVANVDENQSTEEDGSNEPDNGTANPNVAETDTAEANETEPNEAVASEVTSDSEINVAESDGEAEARDPEWVTLGSLSESSPKKMLVWFTSRGAAIECLALNDKRYTDLDDRHGYLGYLALEATSDGLTVHAVGDGTPAALATTQDGSQSIGLQPGDILQKAGDRNLLTLSDYQTWIESTRPGETVQLTVRRMSNEVPLTVDYQTVLRKRPLELLHPEPRDLTDRSDRQPFSYLMSFDQLGKRKREAGQSELPGLPSLKDELWEVSVDQPESPTAVEFTYRLTSQQLAPFNVKGPLRVVKRFAIPSTVPNDQEAEADSNANQFHLDYSISIYNEATDGEPIEFAYEQDGPTGLPLEGWWYTYKAHSTDWGGAGVRDVIAKTIDGKHKMFANKKMVERLKDNPQNPSTRMYEDAQSIRLQYIGVDAQYFTSALLPRTPAADSTSEVDADALPPGTFVDALAIPVAEIDPIRANRTNVSFELVSPVRSLPPGGSYQEDFQIFAGPKSPPVLEAYGLGECITYGWFPLVSKPLQWILHKFYWLVRNYGIAIIMLTVLVRGCMYPLGMQQARNAQKMQELAPEMRRIAEKYKKDMEKRAAAQRELFQKHNYNPMAGCLPLVFQMPIFIGLYRALSVDIELRQAALIPGLRWCSNLAGPDQLFYWEPYLPAFIASRTGWLGPYLNILPLISVAFMMLHQKLFTPPATDEQQEVQQKVMKFMLLFFAFFFFRVPAGLCLYFITSSAWGLAERKLLPKTKPRNPDASSNAPGSLPKPPGGNGANDTTARRRSKSRRR